MSWFEHGKAQIYYEESGEGIPALMLPGFAGSIDELTPLRESLAQAGYRVIAADLPGSGRSLPQPRQYLPTFYTDDASSFAALLRHLSAAPAHLIGFSDGGEVALLMAALDSGMARSVVTWGAAGQLQDPAGQLRSVMFNLIDDPIPPMQEFRNYLVTTYGESNARSTIRSQTEALGAIINSGGDISLSRADRIAHPVLLISGEHDMFAPPALVDQLAARIHGAERVDVTGAGHDVHRSHGDWLAHAVLEWLKKH